MRRKQAEIDRVLAEGRERVGELSEREFLMAGIALYAGEGAKADKVVKLTNTDPRIIRFFCVWLRHCFDIDERRLRGQLYLLEGLDLKASTRHWAELAGIPSTQFIKPYRAVADSSIRQAKHVHGCFSVSYSCTATHRGVMGLVHALLGGAALPG